MPDGSGYLTLLDFAGATNGNFSWGSLISYGTSLYGMTLEGGTNNLGVVFKFALGAVGIDELSMDTYELSV